MDFDTLVKRLCFKLPGAIPSPLLLVVLVLAAFADVSSAQPGDLYRRILVIYSGHAELRANLEISSGMQAVLDTQGRPDFETYSEFRDLYRFPGDEADGKFVGQILEKFRDTDFDAVVAVGIDAIGLARDYRDLAGADFPIVFGAVPAQELAKIHLPEHVAGITNSFDLRRTFNLARTLQPNAARAVVLTGSGEFDHLWQNRARKALADVEDIPVDFVSNLTLKGFEQYVAGLDPNTIVIFLMLVQDEEGRQYRAGPAAGRVAAASTAPVYGFYDTFVGLGPLGGQVEPFRDMGVAMAQRMIEVLNGTASQPAITPMTAHPLIDWQQLRRFGIDEALLPADTQLINYDPSLWELYWHWLLMGLVVLLLQFMLIGLLVVQNARRERAERLASDQRLELAHLSRVSQLGELSGALAHELNQPLTSILANAEAGRRLIARDPPDMTEIGDILADIAEDDRRAAGIITGLRRLMARGETAMDALDLNEVVRATVRLTANEMVMRGVTVETHLIQGALPVKGNMAQLQQVLLNLMLNAADALAGKPQEARRMEITTMLAENGTRELAVQDQGDGLHAEIAADPFRPFSTTKGNGMGLGLSICNTIAHAHGGGLHFEQGLAHGARVTLRLPAL
ncbi:ATP-binding protein [Paracoccus sp. Z330]|uniref:histidine kinase n=1 Tax=Paracoccus onchidii TaxID=3017813 RepID=A0ABT4ZKP8_9RHOB|nr:ATP-binding protein [Paracoccus onchidii]MDB6179657.1 ATP-binding protein [Paracoccus onchidii]